VGVAERSLDLAILVRRQAQVLARLEALAARLEVVVLDLESHGELAATHRALQSALESGSSTPASGE
jgi:hypothetical protein